jgi:PBP1b-binding outer membrane lipoprotein LpoB
MKNKVSLALVMVFLLTACSGTSNSSDLSSIDFNQDVALIAKGVERFERNSQKAIDMANQDANSYAGIVAENKAALDDVELATEVFLRHINQASSQLPSVDTTESPSKSKMLAWANGYKSWVYYQRQAQSIGEKCLSSEQNFTGCLLSNFSETLELERLSQVDLKNAVAGIQEWRNSLGYE